MLNLQLIKNYEGFRANAYPDPASGGEPWTVGYGSTHHLDGSPVRPGDTVTEAQASAMLLAYVEREILPSIERVPGYSAMSDDQRSALVDFAYNLGPGDLFPPHTLGEALAARRWADVPAALLLYDDPGTDVQEGLLRRREAEAALWRQGMAAPLRVTLAGSACGAPARLDGGSAQVGVRSMVAVVSGASLRVEGATATVLDATGAPHPLPLAIVGDVGYVPARALADALGLTVTYDAAQHVLAFAAPEA